MSIDMEVFQQFAEGVKTLGDRAQPTDVGSDEERVRIAKNTFVNKLTPAMGVDLESCVHCGLCARACHFHESTQNPKYTPIRKLDLLKRVYRRELAPLRWLHRLYTRDITSDELLEWQELVYDSCTECARCSMNCPMGINIASMVNVMRQGLANAGMIPDELRAMEQEQCGMGTIFGAGADALEGAVEKFKQAGIDIPLNKEKADILVTTSVVDIMLFNDVLIGTAKIMNHLGVDWTIQTCGFEAANFGLLSGFEPLQKSASEKIITAAEACGAKLVITPECGHAYPAMRWDAANEHGKPLSFEVMTIAEYLGQQVKAGKLKLKPIGKHKKVAYHDSCKIGRHSGVFEEPRILLEALDVDYRESASDGVMNWCCGGGAGVFLLNRAAPLRQKAFSIKIQQYNETGADSVVMSCDSCRLNFMNGSMQANWDKNIESLVELVAANIDDAA
jgi:Fe-S oxidoreductase